MRSAPRAVVLGLLATALAVGCGRTSGMGKDDAKAEPEEQATPVVADTAKSGPIEAMLRASSTIEAERYVTVHAESTGRILALAVEEGDKVEAGQLLARIKSDAQASLADRAGTSLEKAKADLEQVESLFAKKVASKAELDNARLAYETALIDVRDRKRDVRNTKVLAPLSGTVTERTVAEGGFVTSGMQLLAITDFDTLVARVFVPEKELDRIRVGQLADVVGKAARGRKGSGTVARIAPTVDAATGTVKVTVALPRELAGGDRGFLPGMYAEVTLVTERREQAVLVAKEAIVWDDEQAYVFVLDGDRAWRKRVDIGLLDDRAAEITSGVELGAEIVVAGHAGLKDGGLVRRVDGSGKPLDQGDVSPDLLSRNASGGT
jgi:RND family efflux transporter MFP subunit